jgi:hypothetical protein
MAPGVNAFFSELVPGAFIADSQFCSEVDSTRTMLWAIATAVFFPLAAVAILSAILAWNLGVPIDSSSPIVG